MKAGTLFLAVVTALASCTQGREIQTLPAPLVTQPAPIQTLPAPLETLPGPGPGPVQTLPAPLETGTGTGRPTLTKACEPGASWREACNDCVCNARAEAMCTARACPGPQDPRDPQDTPQGVPQNRCTPGTSWQEDCNTCHCTSTGLAACTLALCLGSSTRAPPAKDRCTPGTTWMQDCNTCRCTASGVGICTMMMCLRRERDVGADAAGDVAVPRTVSEGCVPGSIWQEDCNSCFCMETGVRACTYDACGTREGPKQQQQQQRCLAGSVWTRDCNICRCTAAGEPACTRRACPPNRVARHAQSVEQGSESRVRVQGRCMPGTSWRQDCNSCSCLGGKPVCTQMACLGSSWSSLSRAQPQLP